MSKIVFLDVDGTLIDYEAKLPASAAKAGMRVLQCRATAEYGDAAMRQQARQPFRHRFHGGDAEIT